MTRIRSLTSRLVLTAVALVAAVSVLIGAATTLVVHQTLQQRLDDEVRSALGRVVDVPPGPDGGRIDLQNQAPGTLIVVLGDDPSSSAGRLVGERGGEADAVSAEVLRRLDGVEPDGDDSRGGEVEGVDLPRLGGYRVTAAGPDGGRVVVGLPTRDVDDAVATLVLTELVLALLAVLAAAGAASLVVRRQLGPLREVAGTARTVAGLPLASGEVAVTERVPEHLTDDRTEVGQVGASLNALLAHVETSLAARHRSEQQVRQFVADASHELRTPLATIRGYTELAERHPDDAAAVRQALARVQVESGRMADLVEDLLLLARLDSGRPLGREPVDLTRLLLEGVADARVRTPDHAWRLELPDDPVEVVGDEARLHQVVTNLLANASRHTPSGTTVTVTADHGGFAVHDDGPGFEPALAGRAFERFTRGDTARSRAGVTSAGLGLALVEAIVAAHDGRVSLASQPGDTTLRVDLPRGFHASRSSPAGR